MLARKSSFTLSKLRFFGLRKPKNPSCYTTSTRNEVVRQMCWTTSYVICYFTLSSSKDSVASITQTWQDVILLVQSLVNRCQEDINIGMFLLDCLNALR